MAVFDVDSDRCCENKTFLITRNVKEAQVRETFSQYSLQVNPNAAFPVAKNCRPAFRVLTSGISSMSIFRCPADISYSWTNFCATLKCHNLHFLEKRATNFLSTASILSTRAASFSMNVFRLLTSTNGNAADIAMGRITSPC